MNVIKRQIRRPVVSRMTMKRMNEHQPAPSEDKKPEEPKVKLTVKRGGKVKEDAVEKVVETKPEEVVKTQEVVVEQEAVEEEKPTKKPRRTKKTEKTTETENEDNKEN